MIELKIQLRVSISSSTVVHLAANPGVQLSLENQIRPMKIC